MSWFVYLCIFPWLVLWTLEVCGRVLLPRPLSNKLLCFTFSCLFFFFNFSSTFMTLCSLLKCCFSKFIATSNTLHGIRYRWPPWLRRRASERVYQIVSSLLHIESSVPPTQKPHELNIHPFIYSLNRHEVEHVLCMASC